jgi:Cu-Zn family superoxide dismutase
MRTVFFTALFFVCFSLVSHAADVTIPMYAVDEHGVGNSLGTVHAVDSKDGLVITPHLKGLPPGKHGFHAHENPNCQPKEKEGKMTAALAAGGHYDPVGAGKHEGPAGKGHLGDLPFLTAAADGSATMPVMAPRLKVADLKGRSLMIHAGGDNYSDKPQPLGGGGARIACGVVP